MVTYLPRQTGPSTPEWETWNEVTLVRFDHEFGGAAGATALGALIDRSTGGVATFVLGNA